MEVRFSWEQIISPPAGHGQPLSCVVSDHTGSTEVQLLDNHCTQRNSQSPHDAAEQQPHRRAFALRHLVRVNFLEMRDLFRVRRLQFLYFLRTSRVRVRYFLRMTLLSCFRWFG